MRWKAFTRSASFRACWAWAIFSRLIERAESAFDKKAAMELERKLRKEEFTLEDFREPIAADPQDGAAGPVDGHAAESRAASESAQRCVGDEKKLSRSEAIINSMTE